MTHTIEAHDGYEAHNFIDGEHDPAQCAATWRMLADLADDPSEPASATGLIADARHRTALGVAHSTAVLAAAGIPDFFLRPGEVAFAVLNVEAGPCSNCHRTLARVMCCWDHRITADYCRPKTWQLGEDRFDTLRHADGYDCRPWTPGGAPLWFYTRPQCPSCKAYDTLDVALEAYGNRTTCRTEGCAYTSWYDIGD